MNLRLSQPWVLFLLALVFTVGLTFASVELPYIVDEVLQNSIATPGGDSHSTAANVYRTELFMGHYHLRLVGYACFGLTLLLIIVGFATRKSRLAAFGAIAFMLPVFAQFAGVMFFLAGLGILNLVWLPVLDISFDVQRLGLIIRAPFDLVMWLFHQVGLNAYWPMVYLFIGGGLLLFFLGTFAWLSARARKSEVADSRVYRFSRHPQYLGWILWTYGLYLLLLLSRYPKRSWGIDASLPWLISTMIIIGVAMLEELNMQRRFGGSYSMYRAKTPFLFPVPAFINRLFSWLFRVLLGKDQPQRPSHVVTVLCLETAVLIGASAFFYGGGMESALALMQSEERQRERIEAVVAELRENPSVRQKYFIAGRLVAFGEPAIPYLIGLLKDEDPRVRMNVADRLRDLPSQKAVPALIEVLEDPNEDVRHYAIGALAATRDPAVREPLLRMLDHPSKATQRIAARALTELNVGEVEEKLITQLSDPKLWVSIGAAEDLGTLRTAEAVPALTEQLGHESPYMRRAVVVALVRIGSPDVKEPLRSALADPDWETRFCATAGLRQLEGK